MFFYHVPDPDEAMLIAGGRAGGGSAGGGGAPFRVVTGRGAWVVPGLRHVSYLSLAMQESEVTEQCVTKQGIALRVQAVCAFKVGPETEAIVNAAQRFLSDQDSMSTLTGRIFAGHLRSIIGAMTVEEIITQRQALASQVLEASKEEMGKLGLLVDSFQISSVDDMGSGYIAAMAAPHNAAIQRAANIAQAEADQESAKAQQESERKQAEYQRDTTLLKAKTKGEETKAEAEAAQAGPLAEAEAQKAVTQSQTDLAQEQAKLRQQQLQSEVVKPAEAQAQKTKIEAVADADATKVRAEAAASNDRVSLDLRLIEQLPEIVERASKGLANANITMLDGADGLAEVTASLVSQGRALFEAARGRSFVASVNGSPETKQAAVPAPEIAPADPTDESGSPGDGDGPQPAG
jgi:flotillin